VRPGWDGVENGSIDIEEGFMTILYAQDRVITALGNKTHLESYCCIQPVGRGLLSGFSGSPGFAKCGEDAFSGAVVCEGTGWGVVGGGPRG
jgi:hypothetical protein